MIRSLIVAVFLVTVFARCETDETSHALENQVDTVRPVIKLNSSQDEVVLLQISSTTLVSNGTNSLTWLPGKSTGDYVDNAPAVLDDVNGEMRYVGLPLEVKGSVNNKKVGEYTLIYTTKDAAGNQAIPVSRKVKVVENDAEFINGTYSAVCSCTALAADSKIPIVSKVEYTTYVGASHTINGSFDLDHLRIGDYDVRLAPIRIVGNSLEVHFYDQAFDISRQVSSGKLAADKKAFNIETTVSLFSPVTKYSCRTIFIKNSTDLR